MRRRHAGFTLIEMMVVMVLLGLLTTLALPAMQRWHDAVRAKAQSMGVVEALRAAAFAAGANRRQRLVDARSFVAAPVEASAAASAPADGKASDSVDPGSREPAPSAAPATQFGFATKPETQNVDSAHDHVQVALPKGWQVDRIEPAAFLANGLCRPGRVDFKTEAGAHVVVDIGGPTCSVGIADPASKPVRP